MTPGHKFVVNDRVLEFFSGRSRREREELLRIWQGLAAAPYQQGEWLQKTASGRELQVERFGRQGASALPPKYLPIEGLALCAGQPETSFLPFRACKKSKFVFVGPPPTNKPSCWA